MLYQPRAKTTGGGRGLRLSANALAVWILPLEGPSEDTPLFLWPFLHELPLLRLRATEFEKANATGFPLRNLRKVRTESAFA